MTPVTFTCKADLRASAAVIAAQILDVAQWTGFRGCWPIPGIAAAEFEVRTPEVVGSRIRVQNGDGSSHTEEIVVWEPEHQIQLRMTGFSAPLSLLASQFIETWKFEVRPTATNVARSFELHARTCLARPALWIVAYFLKRAIVTHLRELESF